MDSTTSANQDNTSVASLDTLYKQKIQEQRDRLQQLLQNFHKRCDEITSQAQQKLAVTPETDKETRLKIFEEQKNQLALELQNLQQELTKSHNETRISLEAIYNQKEAQQINQLEEHILKVYS